MELGSSCVCVSLNRGQRRVPYFKEQRRMRNPGPPQLGFIRSLCLQAEVEDPIYGGSMNQQDQLKVMDRQAKAGSDWSLAVWVRLR